MYVLTDENLIVKIKNEEIKYFVSLFEKDSNLEELQEYPLIFDSLKELKTWFKSKELDDYLEENLILVVTKTKISTFSEN